MIDQKLLYILLRNEQIVVYSLYTVTWNVIVWRTNNRTISRIHKSTSRQIQSSGTSLQCSFIYTVLFRTIRAIAQFTILKNMFTSFVISFYTSLYPLYYLNYRLIFYTRQIIHLERIKNNMIVFLIPMKNYQKRR